MVFRLSLFICMIALIPSCYTFKGTNISADVKTFYVGVFRSNAANAPADIGQIFSEDLRGKVLRESRLAYSEVDSSIEFNGAVSAYNVSSVAPSNDDGQIGSSLNRLTITVNVEYINNVTEEESFTQVFSFFQDFEATENLFDLQEELTETIFDQITEDIFNKAFSNW